jgi:hypothetical protein
LAIAGEAPEKLKKQRSRIEHRQKVSTKDYQAAGADNQPRNNYIFEKYGKLIIYTPAPVAKTKLT